ncbi:MAG: Gmad2 immunoglobulin-like domain-containing protein [Minisyncoccia bacterium]
MKNAVISILVVCAAIAVVLIVIHGRSPASTMPPAATELPGTSALQASSTALAQNDEDSIEITSPAPNAPVKSPLQITGSAKSAWYFEGRFKAEILDASGTVLASAPAKALGDWTGPRFIPFSASLSFGTPTTTTGLVVLKNDNPSGDPSRDVIFAVPVRFK